MTTIPFAAVQQIRERLSRAQQVAASRFRDAFAAGPLPAVAHLRIQAEAILEGAEGVRLNGRLAYDVSGDSLTPFVERGRPVHPFFEVARTPEAVFEYWLVISEIEGSTSWRMTRLIASPSEYDDALRRMQSPQIVRALTASFLPSVEIREDGSAMLEVCVYTRAEEERVERRALLLDVMNEFSFHTRQLIAEGRGGVRTR